MTRPAGMSTPPCCSYGGETTAALAAARFGSTVSATGRPPAASGSPPSQRLTSEITRDYPRLASKPKVDTHTHAHSSHASPTCTAAALSIARGTCLGAAWPDLTSPFQRWRLGRRFPTSTCSARARSSSRPTSGASPFPRPFLEPSRRRVLDRRHDLRAVPVRVLAQDARRRAAGRPQLTDAAALAPAGG